MRERERGLLFYYKAKRVGVYVSLTGIDSGGSVWSGGNDRRSLLRYVRCGITVALVDLTGSVTAYVAEWYRIFDSDIVNNILRFSLVH